MEQLLWVALSLVEGIGNKKLKKLYDYNSELRYNDIISDNDIKKIIKNEKVYEKVIDREYLERKIFEAKEIVANHSKKGIEIVTISSAKYPSLLKLIEDPPVLLYCKGNIELLNKDENLAIIGTREPTNYGIAAAKKVARVFAERGFTIVSGLAIGIDTAGHQGALEAKNGRTIAVMAGSLDNIYPKENRKLAEEILNKDGLLVSEIPLGKKTFKGSFVSRDRIQSGMSLGVCPIQAPLKSGTHHTINFAEKQNRLVFCPVPIEPKDVQATQGIYDLIDTKKVITISTTEDYQVIQNLLYEKQNELKSSVSVKESCIKNAKEEKKNKQEVDENYNLFSISEEEEIEVLSQSLKKYLNLCKEYNLSKEHIENMFLEELNKNEFRIK